MNSKFTLGSFELEFSKTDERLLIQAKDKQAGALISKAITHDSAKALSQEHMLDPDMVHDLLIDFFNNKQNGATLTLSNDGTLKYACQVMYGRISKLLSFTIYLEREDLEQENNRLERLVHKLTERVSELEKKLEEKNQRNLSKEDFEKFSKANDRFLAFEKFIAEKFEKIDDLERIVLRNEERLMALEEKAIGKSDEKKIEVQHQAEIIDWKFNTAVFASKYMFLNHNKTVIAKGPETCTIFAKQALPKEKKSEFTFMIEWSSSDMGNVAVGVASETSIGKNSCLDDKRTFMLTFEGVLYIDGKKQSGYLGFTKGDKVVFSVDMSIGEVNVSVNGIPFRTHTFSKNDRTSYEFYPCVLTGNNKGVGATFL